MMRDQDQREYVVGVDPRAFHEGRAIVLRMRRSSAWIGMIGGALIIGISMGLFVFLGGVGGGGYNFVWPIVLAVPGVILVVTEQKRFARIKRLREVWDAHPVPEVAMRMTPAGVDVAIDVGTGYSFLPWDAIAGFRLRTVGGRQMLQVALAPGVTPEVPDVPGEELARAQRGLVGKGMRALGIRFRVDALRSPLAEIDQAAARFTQGRVRIAAA